jgi:hypothetical protein
MPPMAGLQLIWPSVSMLCVSSSVRTPIRACLGAGMAATYDDDIEILRKSHWNGRFAGNSPVKRAVIIGPVNTHFMSCDELWRFRARRDDRRVLLVLKWRSNDGLNRHSSSH